MNVNSVENKKVALVLGGTTPHKYLIENLKDRAYYTILVDYNKKPPAACVADLHLKESALDKVKVEEIAVEYKASLVISVALDQPLPVAIEVAEKLNLPTPFSLNTALNLTNKGRMKSVLAAYGVDTPESQFISPEDSDSFCNIECPLVIKPEDSTGSRGITIANQGNVLKKALTTACKFSSTGRAIAEKYITGKEIAVDAIVHKNKIKVLLCRERYKQSITKEEHPIQCVATISPANISEEEIKKIKNCAKKINEAFKIHNGVFHIQGILDECGNFKVIEVAGRVSGGPGGFYAIKNKTGIDLINYFLDCYLDEAGEEHPTNNNKFYATGSMYCKEGIMGSFSNVHDLIDTGVLDSYNPYKNPGDPIPSGFTTKNRVAGYAVSANSREELKDKLDRLYELIDVLDDRGHSILLKEIGVHRCL